MFHYIGTAKIAGNPAINAYIDNVAGFNTFFTGMHPEMGPGYADFSMVDGVTYSLRAGDTSKPVAGLYVISCNPNDGPSYPGGIKLIFK